MQPAQNEMALAGTLADFGLVDIIQLIDLGRKTGKVVIRGRSAGRKLSGSIFFDEGKIYHAETGTALGDEAAFLLFGVSTGTFEFVESAALPRRSIFLSNEFVIMEGIARQEYVASHEV